MGEVISLQPAESPLRSEGPLDKRFQDANPRNYQKLPEAAARKLACILSVGAIALTSPSCIQAYGWPVKPFNRQHPIRGALDDPRTNNRRPIDNARFRSFHFGVDVVAPDGAAVYAVEGGEIYVDSPTAIDVVTQPDFPKNYLTFGYWHIRPVVHDREFVAKHQLLGYILKGYEHVHFTEAIDGHYVNPLESGGLTPYRIYAKPVIKSLMLWQHGKYSYLGKNPLILRGRDSLVVNTFDPTPIAPPPPWNNAILTPSVISWRLTNSSGRTVVPEQTVVDFRDRLYTEPLTKVYAPHTDQNQPGRPGNYNFWLIRESDTIRLANGDYDLEVTATDIRGNNSMRSFEIDIDNSKSMMRK